MKPGIKRAFSILTALAMALSLCAAAGAADNSVRVTLDGRMLSAAAYIDAGGRTQAPAALASELGLAGIDGQDGGGYFPLRRAAEANGFRVTWDGATRTAALSSPANAALAKLDMTRWRYDAEDDVYWQTGVSYCASPADEAYETMGLFVPGAYFAAADNGDGTYTCAVNESGTAAGYTAATAPFILPVNTPGYAAMSAPADCSSSCGYGSVGDFTGAGFILAFAGARGRDAGAPAGVTDFKAAIRFVRYNADLLPGDSGRFFSLGMSGGGAQSALIGTTGDSDLYAPYLSVIGAAQNVSDAVTGSMCWCPITNLDVADEAYEWNMGAARSGLDDATRSLSDGMAEEFARYINALELTDAAGSVLVLEESAEGVYQAGSYYEYIKSVVETSLEHFLADTAFPYDASSSGGRGGMGGGFGGGQAPDGGAVPAGGFGGMERGEGGAGYEAIDDIRRSAAAGGLSLSGAYDTAQDYIDALNAEGEWVSYDAAAGKAAITSVADFAAALKVPSKDVGAFDALDRSQGENTLFGYGNGAGAHFDAIEASLLRGTEYESAFAEDLARLDALGSTVGARVNMYNPMYYLCGYYDGAGSSQVAPYFRIRTGINQGDTALCTEVNLALALAARGSEVDFETVWGQGHTMAERSGGSTENFIAWVNACLAEDSGDAAGGQSGPNGGQGGQGGMAANDPDIQAVIDANAGKFSQFSFADADAGVTLEYSLFIPADYDGSAAYPLLMFIPDSTGAGKTALQIVEQYYGADVWVTDEEQAKHPSFVLVPAFSETVVRDDWSASEQIETAVRLIRSLMEEYSIDADRVYATGQSMGCMTSLYLNSRYPDLFAASMFVSGQWDISVLKPLEAQKFFYITAGGDERASGGQDEVMAMFDADGVSYSYGTWDAQDDAGAQSAAVAALLEKGADANMIRFEAGTVLNGQSGMEHMASFNYGYRLTAVRDWLFAQSRG